MKIALNVNSTQGGHSLRGTGVYTKQLLSALRAYEPNHEYVEFEGSDRVPETADVVHYPFFDPFILTLPTHLQLPLVVTVHDLIPIRYAEHFPRGLRGEIKWQIERNRLKKATAIITDSKSSKEDIVSLLPYAHDRTHVVYLAPRDGFSMKKDSKSTQMTRNKYNLSNKSVLYVGDINWNKNVINLIESFGRININKYSDLQLFLVGKAFMDNSTQESGEIDRMIAQSPNHLHIRKIGFVSDEELACLYRESSVLISPSFAEGFGFPVVEAMASGCPVVTSDVSSLKEIAGPSVLIKPESIESISRGIEHVLNMTGKERSEHIQKGLEWVKQYTWKKVAHETVSVYKQIFAAKQ